MFSKIVMTNIDVRHQVSDASGIQSVFVFVSSINLLSLLLASFLQVEDSYISPDYYASQVDLRLKNIKTSSSLVQASRRQRRSSRSQILPHLPRSRPTTPHCSHIVRY